MMRFRHISPSAALLPLLLVAAGCEHKPLWLPESPVEDTEVEYDWSETHDNPPSGMTLYLYPYDTDEQPWLFNLHYSGGIIDVPERTYRVITYNNDTDGVLFRNAGSYGKIEAYTREGKLLDGLDIPYSGTLPSRASEEPVVITPDMMWTAASTVEVAGKRIVITPRRLTPRYRFTVTDISNIGGVSEVCASISGLAGGVFLNDNSVSVYPVTMPSPAKVSGGSIIGGIVTFGVPESPAVENILSVYIWLRDGSKHSINFNVTSQIRDAADPMNVDIEVSGIDLPEIETPPDGSQGGGIGVDVDLWHTVDIELKPID